MLDLGAWFTEERAIPGENLPVTEGQQDADGSDLN
jgi:endogenous inhibitor of DNA gyrase (YacG/DUF329 family)